MVVETSLEIDMGRRYQSAGELAEELRRVLNREPIRARRLGPIGRCARWVRREPTQAALIAVLMILTGLATAWYRDLPLAAEARDAQRQNLREELLAKAAYELRGADAEKAIRLFRQARELGGNEHESDFRDR